MNASAELRYLTWAVYLVIFVLVAVRYARRPTLAHLDMALFFGAAAVVVVVSELEEVFQVALPAPISGLLAALVWAMPYLLLRLVSDFTDVPRWQLWVATGGLALSVVGLVAFTSLPSSPVATPVLLLLVVYFVALMIYDAGRFVGAAVRFSGVTRRRMQAAAIGSGLLGLDIVAAGLAATATPGAGSWTLVAQWAGLGSGLAYFLGFAPPTWVRRAWQEPELRALLGHAASLPQLPSMRAVAYALEQDVTSALGATAAAIGLWDEPSGTVRFFAHGAPAGPEQPEPSQAPELPGVFRRSGDFWAVDLSHPISGPAFRKQRAVLIRDAPGADPRNAAIYAAYQARTVLAAPITAGDRRLGVLLAYAAREPIFANSDLELLQLLADQAAVVLESRALIEETSRLRAREEATRLKEDFLSAAAHDLKTPLTSILAQAQLLQRRSELDPRAPPDARGLERIVGEGRRLRTLVLDLLDASRLDQGTLVGVREPVDLVEVARGVVAEREPRERDRCRIEATAPVVGIVDRVRAEQLVENLVDNAVKYSPEQSAVAIRVWSEGGQARLSFSDRGIGIPAPDLPHLFERFHRGTNVDDRRFAGMGLGLYICRGIVEQHGGRIWAESTLGQGSTFHVTLPLAAESEPAEPRHEQPALRA